MKRDIILASGSPRRKEILETLGLKFAIKVPNISEHIDDNKNILDEIKRISHEKAVCVQKSVGKHENPVIISSDTLVTLNGIPMGKPKDMQDAKCMLWLLSGKTHKVCTAVTLIDKDKRLTDVNVTDVTFFELNEKRIDNYIKTGISMDKAGAYGIQGIGSILVSRIEGDFYSVMGLPVGMLCNMLEGFGIEIL